MSRGKPVAETGENVPPADPFDELTVRLEQATCLADSIRLRAELAHGDASDQLQVLASLLRRSLKEAQQQLALVQS